MEELVPGKTYWVGVAFIAKSGNKPPRMFCTLVKRRYVRKQALAEGGELLWFKRDGDKTPDQEYWYPIGCTYCVDASKEGAKKEAYDFVRQKLAYLAERIEAEKQAIKELKSGDVTIQ